MLGACLGSVATGSAGPAGQLQAPIFRNEKLGRAPISTAYPGKLWLVDSTAECEKGSRPIGPARAWSLVGGEAPLPRLSGLTISGHGSAKVVWSHLPMLPAIARLTVCVPTECDDVQPMPRIVEHADSSTGGTESVTALLALHDGGCPVHVRVQVSVDRLHILRSASIVTDCNSSIVAQCSDGDDNDGDGLADDSDPGCQSAAHRESSDNAADTSLRWEWDTATDGDFMRALRWTNPATGTYVPIVRDEPTAGVTGGCRWWPHGGNCSHWLQSYGNNSARQIQDWAWKIEVPDGHGGGPQYLEQESSIAKRLVRSNATSAVFESLSERLRLADTFTLRGDTMYVSIMATNLMKDTVRATFLTQFGSLQLGPAAAGAAATEASKGTMWHLGNKRLGSLDRNWSYVDACVPTPRNVL